MQTCERCGKAVVERQRTLRQNAAIYCYLRQLAQDLNDAGYDMKAVMAKRTIAIPCTEVNAKTNIWLPVQEIMVGHTNTSSLTTDAIDPIYQVVSRHMAEKFGVTTPFVRSPNG